MARQAGRGGERGVSAARGRLHVNERTFDLRLRRDGDEHLSRAVLERREGGREIEVGAERHDGQAANDLARWRIGAVAKRLEVHALGEFSH